MKGRFAYLVVVEDLMSPPPSIRPIGGVKRSFRTACRAPPNVRAFARAGQADVHGEAIPQGGKTEMFARHAVER